jgi:hypothetical protein
MGCSLGLQPSRARLGISYPGLLSGRGLSCLGLEKRSRTPDLPKRGQGKNPERLSRAEESLSILGIFTIILCYGHSTLRARWNR